MEDNSFSTVEKEHWDRNWAGVVAGRPLSLWNVFNFDAVTLLGKKLSGSRAPSIVEIGFVPGIQQYLIHKIQ